MIGKIKALALALVATAALNAMTASAVQAGSFDIGAQPALLKGQSEGSLAFTLTMTSGGGLTGKCAAASFEGTSVGQAINEATLTPTYGPNCQLFGLALQIQMNGCKFALTGAGQPANTTLVDIVGCTAGKQIEAKASVCTFHIPEQSGLSHMVATNIGINEVTLAATLAKITLTQKGPICPDGNNHVSSNATLSGNTIIKAFKHNGSQQVTKHGHQYSESIAGEQVSLLST